MPVLWWLWTRTERYRMSSFGASSARALRKCRVSIFECSQALKVDFEVFNRFLDGLAAQNQCAHLTSIGQAFRKVAFEIFESAECAPFRPESAWIESGDNREEPGGGLQLDFFQWFTSDVARNLKQRPWLGWRLYQPSHRRSLFPQTSGLR